MPFGWWVAALALVASAALCPPIAQDAAYHQFADQRVIAGLKHFWNVVSNVPFFVVGAYGLSVWRRARWQEPQDRWPWLVAALAAGLIGLGSAYYHAQPSHATLYWDRLPMTLGFMSVFAAALGERVDGKRLLLPLLLLGMASVEYWRRTGDLRLYALVQFFPLVALPLLLWRWPSRYACGQRWWQMGLAYGLAKGFEACDGPLYGVLGGAISGHTLKHLVAAFALWLPLRMLAERS